MRPVTIANICFFGLWIWALLYCRKHSYDDPGSIFFNPDIAYSARYSVKRIEQADEFLRLHRLKHLAINVHLGPQPEPVTSADRFLCIGIPSSSRPSDVYLARTLATLVDNLTPQQRASIFITVLLADSDPSKHLAYRQKWLSDLVDEVLVYKSSANPDDEPAKYTTIHNIGDADRGDNMVQNTRMDSAVLADACNTWGGKYTALIEDDVIASPDWFEMLTKGVAHVQDRSQRLGYDWLYLRLFYTELFMRWTWEEFISSAQMIFVLYVVVFVIFLELRRRRRLQLERASDSDKLSSYHTSQTFNQISSMVIGLWIPALIVLYYLAGKMAIDRLTPFPLSGVRQMPKYGCCGQGLVVPQRQVEGLATMLRTPPFDFAADQMVEIYADEKKLRKFALDQSVLQHVGPVSDAGPNKRVWNFGFERRTDPAPPLS